ncbi:MAG: hypothetical protein R3B65_01530 [Candidatus Paceibacterota bacterium]
MMNHQTVTPPSGGGGRWREVVEVQGHPETGVLFSGRAYPLSKITILKDGQKAIETIAGPDAQFRVKLTDLNPGNYNFTK